MIQKYARGEEILVNGVMHVVTDAPEDDTLVRIRPVDGTDDDEFWTTLTEAHNG